MTRARRADRRCEFRIVDGVLHRTVERRDGRSYRHMCTLESFADVARFIEEHGTEEVSGESKANGVATCVGCSCLFTFRGFPLDQPRPQLRRRADVLEGGRLLLMGRSSRLARLTAFI